MTDHERVVALCDALKFQAVVDVYADVAETAAKQESSYVVYLEQALKAKALRQGRSRHTLANLADGFPAKDHRGLRLGSGAPKQRLIDLAAMAFLERKENVILLGPSGTSKTLLTIALSYLAAQWASRSSSSLLQN